MDAFIICITPNFTGTIFEENYCLFTTIISYMSTENTSDIYYTTHR